MRERRVVARQRWRRSADGKEAGYSHEAHVLGSIDGEREEGGERESAETKLVSDCHRDM